MPKLDKETMDMLASDGQYRLEKNKEKEPSDATKNDIPEYKVKLNLNENQIQRLQDQVFEEFEYLKEERRQLKLEEKWQSADNQYNGEMKRNAKLNFNLHCHQSKIKSDSIVRALNEAFLDSDPIIDVSPRPEYYRENGDAIAQKQTEFVDFAMDEEIKPEKELTLINRSAVNKFVGIGKLEWCYEKERRKREEVYEGKNEILGIDPQGQTIIDNKALKEFLNNYPDAPQRYPGYVKSLMEGKKISLIVDYFDILDNSPKLRYIPIENFYVRNSTSYYNGLRSAHIVVERSKMTWWELKKKESNKEFENVDEIGNAVNNENKEKQTTDKQEHKEYKILECTTYFNINEKDDEETKIICWFEEETKQYLGCILYPFFGFDINYIPFYVKLNDEGFYGGGRSILLDLRDSNIAQDALLNLYMHGTYIRNILTPIVKEGSEIEALFAEQRWTDGKPISVDATVEDVNKAFSFVQYPQLNMQAMELIKADLKRIDSDVSGISDLMTGRENQADPRAPATKTIALLNQSGVNVKDYIRIYLPSFNILVENILQLYYQMSKEGRKYKIGIKSKKVSGKDAFADISRDEMVARTTIQARASSFAFDKINEKQENLAMMQTLMAHPYAMQLPKLQYRALLNFMKSWSPNWKNVAEVELPTPEEFDQEMMQVAMEAMFKVVMGMQQQQQITGVPPQQPQPEQLAGIVKQAQTDKMNPQAAIERQKQEMKGK